MATSRTVGERTRIKHAISRLRTILDQVEMTLDVDAPPGPDVGQAVAHSAVDLACSIARLEAYMRTESDGRVPAVASTRACENVECLLYRRIVSDEECAACDGRTAPVNRPESGSSGATKFVQCDRHGHRLWGGHIVCEACGRRYTTHDPALPTHAPLRCVCRKPLMPAADHEHFTARVCCAECFTSPLKPGA